MPSAAHHAAVRDPAVPSMAAIDHAQQGCRDANAVHHVKRLSLRGLQSTTTQPRMPRVEQPCSWLIRRALTVCLVAFGSLECQLANNEGPKRTGAGARGVWASGKAG